MEVKDHLPVAELKRLERVEKDADRAKRLRIIILGIEGCNRNVTKIKPFEGFDLFVLQVDVHAAFVLDFICNGTVHRFPRLCRCFKAIAQVSDHPVAVTNFRDRR